MSFAVSLLTQSKPNPFFAAASIPSLHAPAPSVVKSGCQLVIFPRMVLLRNGDLPDLLAREAQ